MIKKTIIFDAGTLITLAMNGLLPMVRELKKIFDGTFLITYQVKYEVIDRPMNTKRFELEALQIQSLLDDNIIELPDSLEIQNKDIEEKSYKLMEIANSIFASNDNTIKIVDLGEISCLALSHILNQKNIINVISVDERTIRMLSEKPDNLKNLLQRKLKTRVSANPKHFEHFREFRFIRSAELAYVAYKKGLIKLKGKNVLDALLFAVKFKGCAISGDEINEIKKLAN